MASSLRPEGPEPIARRRLLIGGAGLALAAAASPVGVAAQGSARALKAAVGRVPMVGDGRPETAVWCYDGAVPGPELRFKQGDRVRIEVENDLDDDTTVHWHGLRVPNAMDGVPHLTQLPIRPGGRFVYEFDALDAGTFWYHPHHRSFAQIGRGLAGALVVEERMAPPVDRDVTWVLSDWRLGPDAQHVEDFGDMHDVSHAGRLGNTVTVNGRVSEEFAVRAGERLRLRLVNAANARIFGLRFGGHAPHVVAIDGQPVEPHRPDGGVIVVAPGMRTDLIVDLGGNPGTRHPVLDAFDRRRDPYRVVDLAYSHDLSLRDRPPGPVAPLPANPLAEPTLAGAERHEIVLGGGMMGRRNHGMVRGQRMDMRQMMHNGLAWTINGVAAVGHMHEPMLSLRLGQAYVLAMRNDTAWHHPMHLHGHAFRVLARNGKAAPRREWQDTVLIGPGETADVAFVADNPGNWMFHCHILEHQLGGMMGVVRVA
ncbi:MAG: multicopper oxidase family protein [Alphaproteobacteria bacterium]|nr:multicopper oxidase family protein [Alphaproteobacteria bacterium]